MRITGLASGLDTEQLVKDIMRAERLPLDKLTQKKQTLEWQRDDYREMNTLLKDLDTLIFEGIDRQSEMLKKTVSSTDESAVTATANASAATMTTQIDVTNLAKPATWISDSNENFSSGTARTISLSVTNGDGTTNNNVTIDIAAADTLDDVISAINNKKELGISVFHDTQTDKVVITKNETGAAAKITIDDAATQSFFTELGFTTVAGKELGDSNGDGVIDGTDAGIKAAGEDAQFTINGLSTSRSTNTFAINNITYTLKKESASSTISILNDTDTAVDTIVKFIDKYNETIEKINEKLTEEKYRDFKPLTAEQKEVMTEKEIELWEEKAKSGLLKGDSILSSSLSQMRMDIYSSVQGTNTNANYDQLSEIGITTSSNYLDRGKLFIDETKLRDAITADPEAVYELFNSSGTTSESTGIAGRLRDSIENTIGKIEEKAGNTLKTNQQFTIGRNLESVDKQIDSFEDRLIQIEDRYWRQFTALETAMQRANSQGAYLMQQFGGGF